MVRSSSVQCPGPVLLPNSPTLLVGSVPSRLETFGLRTGSSSLIFGGIRELFGIRTRSVEY